MKWLCFICRAINAAGANVCHNCGSPFGSLFKPEAP